MVRMDQEAFLTQLAEFYKDAKQSGSVSLSFKKVTEKDLAKGQKKGEEGDNEGSEASCLVRAIVTGGDRFKSSLKKEGKKKRASKLKISTLVSGKDQEKFHSSLASLNKANMDALKKRKKKKKKVTEAKRN